MNVSTIKGFETSMIRHDVYHETFLNDTEFYDPYSSITVKRAEVFASTHLYYNRMNEFMLYKVFEKTGLSFTEFLKLPTFLVERTLEQLRFAASQDRSGNEEIIEDIKKTVKETEAEFPNSKRRR